MKCFELQGPDGIEGLKLIDKPKPMPGPGQVLVRIKAATLNYRDLLTVKGGYGSRQKFPLIPVSDGAGVVETTGPDVGEFVPGDRVVGSFFETWIGGEPTAAKMRGALGGALDGVLAEYRIFPSQALVRAPDHLTDVEAAALPCAGLTAWSAVVKLGGVKAGQTVLTQGTGGVSIFAVQFAKMCGARVIATSSSDAKLERLKSLGADATINYRTAPDWGKKARELTGEGVDLVVEVRRRRHAERVDPGDAYRRDHRFHRRAGWSAASRTPPAIDRHAAAAAAGRNSRVGRGSAGDVRRDRHQRNEAGDRQDVPVRPSCGRISSHGKRRALRKSGHRDRMMMTGRSPLMAWHR